MRFLLCLFLPPLGILTIRPGSFLLCLLLCVVGYVPAMAYGLICWTRRNDHLTGGGQGGNASVVIHNHQ